MKQLHKNAFTMIELIFVIIVLGILSAVAIPKFSGTKNAADAVKGKADVATIRSAILNERQTRVIKGCSKFIANGTSSTDTTTCPSLTMKQLDANGLFGGVLQYPMPNKVADGAWSATAGSGTYTYKLNGVDVTFTYTPGTGVFTCSTVGATAAQCKSLIE